MSRLSLPGLLAGAHHEPGAAHALEPLLQRRIVLASARTVLALTLSAWQLAALAGPVSREGLRRRSAGQSGGTAQPLR